MPFHRSFSTLVLLLPVVSLLFLSPLLTTPASAQLTFQFGTVEATHLWQTVNFDSSISNPLVFAGPASYRETTAVLVQVRDVTSSTFTIRVREESVAVTAHAAETVSWMVVATGQHTINGIPFLAGLQAATTSHLRGGAWDTIGFSALAPLSQTPLVLTMAQTLGTDEIFNIRKRNIDISGNTFQLATERNENVNNNPHTPLEDVAWFVMERGTAGELFGGIQRVIEIVITPNSVTHSPYAITFSNISPQTTLSLAIAQQQTTDGGNTAWTRSVGIVDNVLTVFVEEEQTQDSEVSHTTEIIGALALSCSVPSLEDPEDTFSNAQHFAFCPFLFFSFIPGEYPWVEITADFDVGGVIADVYLRSTVAPNLVDFDAADTSRSSQSTVVALVNPDKDLAFVGIYRPDDAYTVTLSRRVPNAPLIPLGYYDTVDAEHEWATFKFNTDAQYQTLFVTAESNSGAPLQMYIQAGSMATIDKFEFSTLAPKVGETFYEIPLTLPTQLTDYFISVYVPSAPTDTITVRIMPAEPVINSLDPSFDETLGASTFRISGTNLGTGIDTIVQFGSVLCNPPYTYTSTEITCVIPPGQGTDKLVNVTHYGVTSASRKFNYDPPDITSVTVDGFPSGLMPTRGGTELILAGESFGLSGTVFIDSTPCTLVPGSYGHREVRCVSPEGQGEGLLLSLVVGGQESNLKTISYQTPVLESIDPTSGPTSGNVDIVLYGSNFGTGGETTVEIGSKLCPIVEQTHDNITCTLPAGAGANLLISVRVASQTGSNPNGIVFAYDLPVISEITPNTTLTDGGEIVITGSNFGAATGTVPVGGSGATCSPTAWDHTEITCTIPPGQGAGLDLSVTVAQSQLSNIVSFSYLPPTITSVTPEAIPTRGGQLFTIRGTSLGIAETSVSANSQGCTIPAGSQYHNHTHILCVSREGQGKDLPIYVVVGLQQSNELEFSYTPPAITEILPSNGTTIGSTLVQLTGTNFGSSGSTNRIVFGVQEALCSVNSEQYSHELIQCLTPAGQGTDQDVVVIAGGQRSDPVSFNYNPPQITGMNPAVISTAGEVEVDVNGLNLGVASKVFFNSVPCPLTASGQSHTRLTCTAPEGRGTSVNVTVVVADQSDTSFAFSYAAPTISQVTAVAGAFSTSGNVLLSISGSSFDTDGTVFIGSSRCDAALTGSGYDHDAILCGLPEGQGTGIPVIVQTVDLRNSTAVLIQYDAPNVEQYSTLNDEAPTDGGITLTIEGTNFGKSTPTVTVGGESCPVTSHSHILIECDLPPGEGQTNAIVVTAGGQPSTNSPNFAYDGPKIFALVPPGGLTNGGYNLTIVGSDFGRLGSATAKVGEEDCPILAQNTTHVICQVPEGSGNELVRVTVDTTTSTGFTFAYDAPTISTVSPQLGRTDGGDILTLHGSSFGRGVTIIVLVGGLSCGVTSHNHSTVLCTTPKGTGSEKLVIMTVDQKPSDPGTFGYLPPSLLVDGSGISPGNGPTVGGTTLVLQGANFGVRPKASVTVGTKGCTITTFTSTRIECSTAESQGADLNVTVTVDSQVSNKLRFSYDAPNITEIIPQGGETSGENDYAITLNGANFGTEGDVLVGGKPCTTLTASQYNQDQIICSLPEGQDFVNVTVTVGGQVSEPSLYRYATPQIFAFSPTNGPTDGLVTLTVSGRDFGTSGQLTIGNRPCSVANLGTDGIYDHGRIECEIPSGAGIDQLVRIDVGSQSYTADPVKFDYDAPVLDVVEPNNGPTQGNVSVTVRGSNFGVEGELIIEIDGERCNATERSHDEVICTLPEGSGASRPVQVFVQDQSSARRTDLFRYAAPQILNISSPDCVDVFAEATTIKCKTDATSLLTIYGNNFGPAGVATIDIPGDPECVTLQNDANDPHHILYCELSASIGFDIPIEVVVNGAQSNTKFISYSGPLIYSGTLRVVGRAITSNPNHANLSSVDGGDVVEFRGEFLRRTDPPTVRYGQSGSDPLEYACDVIFASKEFINCTIAAGMGRDLVFQVNDGLQTSLSSDDTVTYPRPVIFPNTIRTTTSQRSDSVSGALSEGDFILFDVTNITNDASKLSVRYGLPGSDYPFACNQVSVVVSATNTSIQCRTSPGEGRGYVFVLVALNYPSLPGTDVYEYPQAPIVIGVRGCDDGDGVEFSANGTINCPTSGNRLLSITGSSFSELASVKIGINDCLNVDQVNSKLITCTLPVGTGLRLPVVVASGLLFSRSKPFVSYALPTLTSVSGCAEDDGLDTAGCNRFGGDTIVIDGDNLGVSGATVLIGGENCDQVEHDADTPHQRVTCRTPAGARTNRAVILLQSRGELSNQRFIAYSQCPAGTYDSSNSTYIDRPCTNCTAGTFSSVFGSLSCTNCEDGFFAEDERSTSCQRCPKGSFSTGQNGVGPTFCTQCPIGTFTNTDGQGACIDCPAGTFSNALGRTTCADCPKGTQNPDDGQSECTNCTAGKFASSKGTLTCSFCPLGRFSDSIRAEVCTQCEPGKFAPSVGAQGCTKCPLGRAIAAVGQFACLACDSGYFANDTGLDVCLTCPPGSISLKDPTPGSAGPDECSLCEAGSYIGVSAQATCLKCSKGSFSSDSGFVACDPCDLGQYADAIGLSECFNCSEGTIAPTEGTVSCEDCPAGSFAAGVKQSACVLCDAGRYQPNPAEGACLPCPVGEAQSSVGQPNCKQCDVGLFADTPATVTCSRCEPGFIAESQGSTGCEPCEPGEFSDSEAQGFCKDCAAGSISTEYNSTACTRCPIGSIAASAGLSQCTNCSAGFFSPAVGGQACERCEKGSFAPRPGLGACTACPVGKAQPLTSQPACASCAAGKFTGSIGQADCKQCQPGTFSNVSTSSFCYECAPGTYQGASDKSVCELCPVGRFNPSSGQPSCTACPVGKYANVEGLEQCIACDEGKFASVQESVVCTNCTAGKFAESKDTQLCTACEPGTYTPRDGMQRCLACEPGRYQPDTNKVECIICDVGKVQSATGQARCIDCAVGQYQPEKGKVACLDCPAGKITSRVARSVCTNCTQGTFAASEGSFTCPLCPVGRFASRDGLSSCTACPAGSFQGLSGQSECEECPAGEFTSFPGQSRCEPCSAGSYANGTGLDKCTSCERGRFSDARAGLCTPCVAGRFASVRGLDTCVDCPVGSFAAQSGQSFCQSCSPGKFASSARSTKCTDCVAGRAASGNGTQLCTVCGQGSFSPEDGSTSCTDCEAGKFQNSEGETQCIPCSVGEFAPATGQPLCSPCSIGFFAEEESSSACDPCPVGSAQPSEGASACIDCRIGAAIGVEGQALCKECDAGFFANETGTVECTPCPLGKFSTKHATTGRGAVECVACAPGRFTSAIGQPSCLPCEFGTFGLVSGLSSCSACPAGRSVDFSAAVECVDCDPGSFSNDGAVTCSLCAPGRFMPNSSATECDVCPSGKFRDFAGATDCQDCAAGRFVTVTESLQCEKCPLGRAVSVNGSSVCDECVPGRFQSDVGQLTCDQCPRGKFAVISGASECQSCPAGSFNNITDQDECFPCLEGTATNELGATRCPECPIGRAILATGQTSCRFCSAGRFANVTGMTGCTACPKGSFQSAQGNETCVLCPAGRFQDSLGQSECKLCPAGTTANETGSTTCRQCLPGFFQEKQEQLECDECPPGRFTSVSGRTTCRQCQPGFVQPSNRSTECIPCDSGDFQPLPGQEACDPCPAGTFTSGGGDTCIDCPTGRFQNVSQASDCIDCPAGWFQAQRGQEECDECPPGEYSPVARQSRCSQCEPGHFTPFNGTIRCSECDAGKLQAFSGGTTCRNCSAGTFTSADGLSACDICEPGRFSPTPGQTRCTQCIAGQFQQFSGGIKCTNCSAGTYNAVEGQSFCFDCERGKRNDRNGSTECVDCEAGWYLGGEGETGCERCPVGRFAPVEGRFECDECDKGRFANETGSSVCFACDEGKKQGSFGETTCDFCDPGRYARATASVACTPCDAGEYAPSQGMSVCLDCPAGRAQDRIGRDECTVCQPGSAAVSGSAECSPCTFRSVAPLEGTRECTDCPQDADTLDQEYCRCRKGFFSRRVANSTNVALVECISCPEGARCDSPGVEWETLETEEGWWRASNDSLVFYRCLIKSHCASGRASQEGSPCLGNRDGPICASCKEGYQATSMTAECTPCPSRQKALVSSVIVSIVIVLALIFMYWVVLRSDRSLMDDAKRNAEAKRANEWAWFEEDEDQFMRTQKQAVFRRAEDGGQGEEIPNFTYKMKIILGFFQITTNLALALDAPWPTRYQEFISVFSLVNFDFISWSSVTCVVETNFYTQFWALTLTPLIVFVLVFIFYLVPRYVMYVRVEENYDLLQAARKREVRQFWKLLLFTLFLIYPGVSSTVMRVYVCREINDRKYLLADFSVECGGANWTKHAYIAIGFVLVYPIGIPVFFWWMMRSNLGKLNHPDVRVQLGFLYEAYSASLWWFELPDMANKLFLTSIVAFFEQTWQLPIAMVWAIGYLIVLLWLNPYVRGGDDRLHLFAQTEIFLLILVAYIFVNGEDFNENSDAALSGVMIVVILGIMLLFLGQVARAVVRVVRARLDMAEKIQDAGEGEAVSDSDIEGGDTVRDEATATSVVELRLPKDALMIRNPLFGSSTALLDGVGTYDDEDSESDDDVSVSKGRMGVISEAYRAGGIAGSPKSGNGQHKQVIEMAQQRKQSMRDLLGVEVDANSKVGNGGSKRRSESDNSSNRSERSEPDDDGDDDGERVGLGEGLVRSSSAGPVSTNDQVPEETNGLMRRAPKKVNKLGLAPDSLYAQLMGKKDKVEEVVDDEVEVSDDEVDVSDDEVADDGGEAGGPPETGVVQVQQDVIGGVGGGGEGGGGEGGTGGGTGTGSVPWMQPVAAMSDGEEEEPETGSNFTRTFGARKPRRRFD